jgi:hypothetical protein
MLEEMIEITRNATKTTGQERGCIQSKPWASMNEAWRIPLRGAYEPQIDNSAAMLVSKCIESREAAKRLSRRCSDNRELKIQICIIVRTVWLGSQGYVEMLIK